MSVDFADLMLLWREDLRQMGIDIPPGKRLSLKIIQDERPIMGHKKRREQRVMILRVAERLYERGFRTKEIASVWGMQHNFSQLLFKARAEREQLRRELDNGPAQP